MKELRKVAFSITVLLVLTACTQTSVKLTVSPDDITLLPNSSQSLSTTVSVSTNTEATVEMTQVINVIQGVEGGVSLDPPTLNGISTNKNVTSNQSQTLSVSGAGIYEILTTARVTESGKETNKAMRFVVEVPEPDGNHELFPLGFYPGVIPENSVTDVVFSVNVVSSGNTPPDAVLVQGDIELTLNNAGTDGDLVAGDRTYSGTFSINTEGIAAESCFSIWATAMINSNPLSSPAQSLCVSSFPVEGHQSDLTQTILDPDTNVEYLTNELMIIVKKGTSEVTITQLAQSVNGEVVQVIPEINTYTIRLLSPIGSIAELNSLIQQLEQEEPVKSAHFNSISETNANEVRNEPNDEFFEFQEALNIVRAPEAWNLAIGKTKIAIVDSGADFSHPDLSTKLIKGKDYIDGGDPDDGWGHGTHVAGIAGALTNNNELGVAGVSWLSKLLIIRTHDNSGKGDNGDVAQGIIYAARNGAEIINLSVRSLKKSILCDAVDFARTQGSIVVAGAGNDSTSDKRYPAACNGSLSVGATDQNDARASFSNYGSWVDIAAPGVDVYSTVPTGSCSLCKPSGYSALNGTSQSAPIVSGALAMIMARSPGISISELEARIKSTAHKLPGADLGAGRLDIYEAMYPIKETIAEANINSDVKTCLLDWYTPDTYVDNVSEFRCDSLEPAVAQKPGADRLTNMLIARYSFTSASEEDDTYQSLDFSRNQRLRDVHILHTGNFPQSLKDINFKNNPNLELIELSSANTTDLDLSYNSELSRIHIQKIYGLTSLDLRANKKLTNILLGRAWTSSNNSRVDDEIQHIDLSNQEQLGELSINFHDLRSLDTSANSELWSLTIPGNYNLCHIDTSNNPKLRRLMVQQTGITSLDLSNNPEIEFVNVSAEHLTASTLSHLSSLEASGVSVSYNHSNHVEPEDTICY